MVTNSPTSMGFKKSTLFTEGRESEPIPEGTRYINKENIFIEEGAEITFAILNASKGPIYIGKDAVILENTAIKGPFAMCEHAIIKMGAKIYGATTLGPYCKVGGEVSNSVLFGYSSCSVNFCTHFNYGMFAHCKWSFYGGIF